MHASAIFLEENKPGAGDDTISHDAAKYISTNDITSFNGRLNQYLFESRTSGLADETANVPTPRPVSSELNSTTLETGLQITDEGPKATASPNSKRRRPLPKASTRTTSTSTDSSPSRMTRLRSSQSSSHAPVTCPGRSTSAATKHAQNKRTRPRQSVKLSTPATCTQSLLRDAISPGLILLLVGVNPGIRTGITGFAYAHPSNLFWKLLHSSGITTVRHPPSDTYKLPELYSVGNTNLVERPTRDASMLKRGEMDAGVQVLEAKIATHRPEVVCLVGKSVWEAVWRVRYGRAIRKEEFRYGWQDERENLGRVPGVDWCGASVFVATTTSGLAAGMKPVEKEAVWAELGSWVVQRRAERALAFTA